MILIAGSSGNFRGYTSNRTAWVSVVSGENSSIAYRCIENPLVVEVDEGVEFVAITVENRMDVPLSVHIAGDFSNLPPDATGSVEGTIKTINPGEAIQFEGEIESTSSISEGPYEVPITIYADWDGGNARIDACSIWVTFNGGPTIRKDLLTGELEVPAHTYQQWTFRISVTSPELARNLTIKDVVPGEFDIDSIVPSAGTYSVVQTGAAHHITWNVEVPADGSAHLDVTIHTKLNPAGKQEFTSCGEYPLNEGAEIEGYEIRSDGINVTAICDGGNDCYLCVKSIRISGPRHLRDGTPADYHTRIFVKNMGAEKDLTVTQYVGKHFTVESYSTNKGAILLTNVPNGKTEVKWTLHLEHGGTATLDLYEHTDGISISGHSKNVLLVSRPCIAGCGCSGCSTYVHVYKCGCQAENDNEFLDESLDDGKSPSTCEGR
ncbi:hypothetical protein [Thermococcus sp. MAR1]|uniref:COG1470 family protein n=1 Tax=Thermococcus sp. MAR1 TaxID=1638263 RepID=UPI00143B8280|nr:hypothetical protein [Thermococcus sp. MAR1]NJE11213.1 hypothetical protein [Thermococcus sp. MAR1]